jgi:ligand-binding SRPBCC domain-containing protein
MTDKVQYRLPFGWLGDIIHHLLVKRQLNAIFQFRFNKVIELFDTP